MAYKTYMQLVNEAISEAKVTLDPLDSTTFASPPRTALYTNFKNWVNRAYKDILVTRDEWNYRVERGTCTVYPRLQIVMTGMNVINIGDTLVGDVSSVEIQVVALHSAEDVENDTAVEYTVSVSYPDEDGDNLILNETVSRTAPSAASSIGSIKGRGVYDLHELVQHIYRVNEETFTMQELPLAAGEGQWELGFITSLEDLYSNPTPFDVFNAASGKPVYVYRTRDGNYDFYPRINKAHKLSFYYAQDIVLMVNHGDVPALIDERYQDLILWKALAEYADYDERPKVYARAMKNVRRWQNLMDIGELPTITLNTRRFDYGG